MSKEPAAEVAAEVAASPKNEPSFESNVVVSSAVEPSGIPTRSGEGVAVGAEEAKLLDGGFIGEAKPPDAGLPREENGDREGSAVVAVARDLNGAAGKALAAHDTDAGGYGSGSESDSSVSSVSISSDSDSDSDGDGE